jgi:hypothetical protein
MASDEKSDVNLLRISIKELCFPCCFQDSLSLGLKSLTIMYLGLDLLEFILFEGYGYSSVVDCLPSMYKALGLISSTEKTNILLGFQ